MQGRFKMEYRLFTIVRYNYNYRDYNNCSYCLLYTIVPVFIGPVHKPKNPQNPWNICFRANLERKAEKKGLDEKYGKN